MKTIILLALLVSVRVYGSVDSVGVEGKIVSFDPTTVTIEIAGEKYKFNRAKLGKEFSIVKYGEKVTIQIDKTQDSTGSKK